MMHTNGNRVSAMSNPATGPAARDIPDTLLVVPVGYPTRAVRTATRSPWVGRALTATLPASDRTGWIRDSAAPAIIAMGRTRPGIGRTGR